MTSCCLTLNLEEILGQGPTIYYPVKLDHRGILYCITPYFDYQSSDLTNVLILFSITGVFSKNNLEDIKYLKSYGVNTFAGVICKGSMEGKCKWIDNNFYNIIDYIYCVLIKKAKENF